MLYLGLKNVTSNRLATYGELGGGGSSGGGYTISTKSINYTETATSGTIILLGNTTNNDIIYTLANAIGNTSMVVVKKIASASQLIINTYLGTQTIDERTSIILNVKDESITIVSNGTEWFII